MTWKIFLLKNHAENNAGKLVPDTFLFCKKDLYKVKASGQHLSFNNSGRIRLRHTKKQIYCISDCLSRDMLNVGFS